jgi:hypothetical protein
MVSKAHIDTLIKESRYDLEILPELEAYVEHQAATNAYDLEANLACLKLYQVRRGASLAARQPVLRCCIVIDVWLSAVPRRPLQP